MVKVVNVLGYMYTNVPAWKIYQEDRKQERPPSQSLFRMLMRQKDFVDREKN
jgi:hypothetical protein